MRHQRLPRSSSAAVFPELTPAAGGARTVTARDMVKQASTRRIVFEQPTGAVRHAVLTFSNIHQHGELFVDFMRARKSVFVDRLGWDMPCQDGMEFDQYDNPLCRWVVLHEYGQVIGGIRLMHTTARCGLYSYMLRDAQLGLLDQIPRDVLFFDAPQDPSIVEASRLFIVDAVPAHRRSDVQKVLMQRMAEEARAMGATRVIGIVPWVWARWLKRIGLNAVPVGRKFTIGGTSSQAALFNLRQVMH